MLIFVFLLHSCLLLVSPGCLYVKGFELVKRKGIGPKVHGAPTGLGRQTRGFIVAGVPLARSVNFEPNSVLDEFREPWF